MAFEIPPTAAHPKVVDIRILEAKIFPERYVTYVKSTYCDALICPNTVVRPTGPPYHPITKRSLT
jgi:hypothetical protein